MELCLKTFKFLIGNKIFLVFFTGKLFTKIAHLTTDDLEEMHVNLFIL